MFVEEPPCGIIATPPRYIEAGKMHVPQIAYD
jgi:hypothetical protein